AATFVIALAMFMYWTSGAYQNVDVRLFEPGGTLLQKNFSVSWYHPDTGPQSAPGYNGNALLRGLPVGLAELDLGVTCPGHRVKDKGPYPITDRVVRVTMIPDVTPPLASENFPYIDPAMVPDQQTVDEQPKVAATMVTLHYQNLTGEDLKLLAWDCYKH